MRRLAPIGDVITEHSQSDFTIFYVCTTKTLVRDGSVQAQACDIRLRGFYTDQPVWVGDLGTRSKNPKLGWFRPENRQLVLYSAVDV